MRRVSRLGWRLVRVPVRSLCLSVLKRFMGLLPILAGGRARAGAGILKLTSVETSRRAVLSQVNGGSRVLSMRWARARRVPRRLERRRLG